MHNFKLGYSNTNVQHFFSMIQKSVYYLLFQNSNLTTDYFDYSLKSNWNASLTTWFHKSITND